MRALLVDLRSKCKQHPRQKLKGAFMAARQKKNLSRAYMPLMKIRKGEGLQFNTLQRKLSKKRGRTASKFIAAGAERLAREYNKTPVRATTVPAMFAEEAAVLKNIIEAPITTCMPLMHVPVMHSGGRYTLIILNPHAAHAN
jgi:hypothetical protein